MFELSDFYDYCRRNDVDVFPYSGAPSAGTTIRQDGYYGIFLDFSMIHSVRQLRGVSAHELGHAATGALHKVSSPYESVERSEYRANRWMAEHCLPLSDLQEALAAGYTEIWEIADYLEFPEEDVRRAITFWQERRGLSFTKP